MVYSNQTYIYLNYLDLKPIADLGHYMVKMFPTRTNM